MGHKLDHGSVTVVMLTLLQTVGLLLLLQQPSFALQCGASTQPPPDPTAASAQPWPIIELRQYDLLPGKRDVLIDLFEAEFIESQEAVGMKLVGTFRDIDRPDRFVWLRAFKGMDSRPEALSAFYFGPTWQAHREAANATMIDASNVLLLRVARPDSGFSADARPRAPKGTTTTEKSLIVATIYHFDGPVPTDFGTFFDKRVRPQFEAVGLPVLAQFVTENSANNFPRLPVRENEHVFVWFTKSLGRAEYARQLARLTSTSEWKSISAALHQQLKSTPEVLRLEPTVRSQLRN